jgi:RHS repeat-associated protein
MEYDIYGKRKIDGGESSIPFRQAGQYEDVETGLYYNRFRYYSPETGMYLSKDPIGLEGNNPNLYAYTYDSNSEVDPFGLDETDFIGTVFRGMKVDDAGKPIVFSGTSKNGLNAANSLGVRLGESGMSTSISVESLPPHRKPTSIGGPLKNAEVFSIDTSVLDKYGLRAVKDGNTHVSIVTKKGIDPSELGERLGQTKNAWKKVSYN